MMSNPAMPGLIKVGMTEKMPHLRAAEISAHEGLPKRMCLEYYVLIAGSARAVEREAHRQLSTWHSRKEWFECDCAVAIAAVKTAASGKTQHERYFHAEREAAEREYARQQEELAARDAESATEERRRAREQMVLESLLRDFYSLEPLASKAFYRHTSILRGIADGLNPVSLYKETLGTPDPASQFTKPESWPLDEILLLAKYSSAMWLLSVANKLPKKGWLEREIKGDFLVVPKFVIDEFTRRYRLAVEKQPFVDASYPEIRIWYGHRAS